MVGLAHYDASKLRLGIYKKYCFRISANKKFGLMQLLLDLSLLPALAASDRSCFYSCYSHGRGGDPDEIGK
jgi:hypothetical protein